VVKLGLLRTGEMAILRCWDMEISEGYEMRRTRYLLGAVGVAALLMTSALSSNGSQAERFSTSVKRDPSPVRRQFETKRKGLTDDDVDGHYDLGLWCLKNGLNEDAVTMLEHAFRKQLKKDIYTRFHLGRAYSAVGRIEDARRQFDSIVVLITRRRKVYPNPELLQQRIKEWERYTEKSVMDDKWAEQANSLVEKIIGATRPINVLIDRNHAGTLKFVNAPNTKDQTFSLPSFCDTIKTEHLKQTDVFAVPTKARVCVINTGSLDRPTYKRINPTYTQEEARVLEEFVREGCGLLLMGNASIWNETNTSTSHSLRIPSLPLNRMPLNVLGARFGITFTHVGQEGRRRTVRLHATEHPCFGPYTSMDVIKACDGLRLGFLKSINPRSKVLVSDNRANVLALVLEHGAGKVVAIGGETAPRGLPENMGSVFKEILEWLGENQSSVKTGSFRTQKAVFESSHIVKEGPFIIGYHPDLEPRLPVFRELLATAAKCIEENTGVAFERNTRVRMLPGFYGGTASGTINIQVLAEDETLDAGRAKRASMLGVITQELTHRLYHGLISSSFGAYFGIKARRMAGFNREADERFGETIQQVKQAEAGGTSVDITSQHTRVVASKGVWVIHSLEQKYPGIVKRFMSEVRKAVPKGNRVDTRQFIHLMSLAADEDLTPWFRQIGTTF